MKKNTKNIISWVIILAIVGLAVWGMVKLASLPKVDRNSSEGALFDIEISSQDWVKGNKDSKVVLVEYSDFECPACGAYHPVLKQLADEYKDKIAFVYRHFPLKQIHKNAELAAYAAEAAGAQGKFWEMHDLIFENQPIWSKKLNPKSSFLDYAERLGLNKAKFENDIEDKTIKNKVSLSYTEGLSYKVSGTPTFFLNGRKIQNPRSLEDFKKIIDQALEENI